MIRRMAWSGCVATLTLGAVMTLAAEPAAPAHRAAHGGCLNALGTCENGHAEARLDGDTLDLWFVGGGTDTARAVRIPDKEIVLTLTFTAGQEPRRLTLEARPNALADEGAGDCSHFAGKADWLQGATAFTARGQVTFRGRQQTLRIEYPKGYDPDEDVPGPGDAPGGAHAP
jgi:hypothetical protein